MSVRAQVRGQFLPFFLRPRSVPITAGRVQQHSPAPGCRWSNICQTLSDTVLRRLGRFDAKPLGRRRSMDSKARTEECVDLMEPRNSIMGRVEVDAAQSAAGGKPSVDVGDFSWRGCNFGDKRAL